MRTETTLVFSPLVRDPRDEETRTIRRHSWCAESCPGCRGDDRDRYRVNEACVRCDATHDELTTARAAEGIAWQTPEDVMSLANRRDTQAATVLRPPQLHCSTGQRLSVRTYAFT